MGKDRDGRFHPPKGRPSGTGRQTELTAPADQEALAEQFDLEDKYAIDADRDRVEGVPIRHPNRNAEKSEDRSRTESQKKAADKSRNETLREDLSNTTPDQTPMPLSRETLLMLTAYTGRCISIYMPTHRTGLEVNEQPDIILFKELLQQVAVAAKGDEKDAVIQRILEPAYALLRDDEFWRSTPPGLAFFMADGFFKFVNLPAPPAQRWLVNTSFLINPLLPYVTSQDYFYLLVLSKKQSKLFRADNFQMNYIEIKELPNGIDDVVHLEEKDDQKLFRTGSSGAGGGASYHGMGDGKPDEKENITLYFGEVDDTLWEKVLHKENVPLVLAGVDYLIPLYKKVTRYNHVWDKALTGSLEHESERELFSQARKITEAYFQERTKKALAEFGNRSATGLASTDLRDIIPAAYYARVGELFVEKNEHLWGAFNETTQAVTLHDRQENGDDDLLDKIVIKTVLNGGQVHFLDKADMPSSGKVAALLRY
jgi:hypothetical protein